MNSYSRKFTLRDIFNNEDLRKHIPQVKMAKSTNKKEKKGKYDNYTSLVQNVMVYAENTAKGFFSEYKTSLNGDDILIDGKLKENCYVNGIVSNIVAKLESMKEFLASIISNADIIESAISDSIRIKNNSGKEPKLYLRLNDLREIKHMSDTQKKYLIQNIMENIYFNDDFQMTQRNKNLARGNYVISTRNFINSYDSLKTRWERKVGI